MTRPARLLIGASLAIAMLIGTAAVASAAPVLTLTPNRGSVTYPQSTRLKIVSADNGSLVATSVTIQYRSIGSDAWKTLRRISAHRTAEGTVTVPVSPRVLRTITGFRAVAAGMESDVSTIAVKARLSEAKATKRTRTHHRITIKGFIWPRHAVGSHPVEVTAWKLVDGNWVEKGTVHPRIVGKTADGSKWQFTRWVGANDRGRWRLRVSHVDEKHTASLSRFSYVRVR